MKLRPVRSFLLVAALVLLSGCANHPPVPDWQMSADSTAQRAVAAFLQGKQRLEKLEFERARAATARTGDPVLLARVELLRCAAQVASLHIEPCTAFEALRADTGMAEQAYADYLAGRLDVNRITLLPIAQQSVATAANPAAALQAITEPLPRLVAAGVLLQTGRADRAVMALATDTTSAQGWRRPLLAWLLLQSKSAQSAGDADEVARLQRRIAIVEYGAMPESKP